jgi:hypothetical protein
MLKCRIAFAVCAFAFWGATLSSPPRAVAVELLIDTGFEDPNQIDVEGGYWSDVYGAFPTPDVNATADPLSGAEHGELILNTTQIIGAFGATMRTSAFAGQGAAESITDFTGETLTLKSNYRLAALNMTSPDPELPPSVLMRTYLAYFGGEGIGFLGFGGLEGAVWPSDLYLDTVSSEYQSTSYSVTVPNFGTPVVSVDFTVGVIAPSTTPGQMTGNATVYIDDVSLDLALPTTTDFNGDGIVDAADYTVWRDSMGMTGVEAFTLGDGDGNGAVELADYELWVSQFGQSVPVGPGLGAVSVPEPGAAMVLVALAAAAMCARHKCRT